MLENSSQLTLDGILIHIIRKKIKHSYLRVQEDGGVIMTANHRLSLNQLEVILVEHLPKLKDKISQQVARHKSKTALLTHVAYLGGLLPVETLGLVSNPSTLSSHFSDTINLWYKKQAKIVFARQFELGLERIKLLDVPSPRLSIRAMKTRYGSYSKSTHRVSLSLWLIKVPLELIDYVIAHELTHIIHYNHSKDFYTKLATLCPNWKELRSRLRSLS